MPRLSELMTAWNAREAETRALLSVPALVAESPILNSDGPTWERTAEIQTHVVATNSDPVVHLLHKQPGTNNPFTMGVTVGRVSTNDIPIDDSSISRFHAWFQKDERTGAWSVTDAESKNGTYVDDRRLAVRERIVLVDCMLLRLGDVEFRFVFPETLRSLVRAAR